MMDTEREQPEREISELLGWRCDARAGGLFVLIKPGGEVLTSAFGTVITHPVESKMWEIYGPKWTRSEEASARLLEMMPYPKLWIDDDSPWWYCTANHYKFAAVTKQDRKVAIALAARAWLQSLTSEERETLHG